MKVKCISLWQPWASLFAAGIKKNETRGWPTRHRGLLAIHAARKRDWKAGVLYDGLCTGPDYSDHIMAAGLLPSEFENLPFGAIVGVVEITDCVPVGKLQVSWKDLRREQLESLLGDYSTGRFAWPAVNARLFKEPIPWKGQQGFFTVNIPDSVMVYAYQNPVAAPQASSLSLPS